MKMVSENPKNEWELREALCEIGRRVWQRNYIASNDGNLSCRLDDHRILATPTRVSKGFMKPEDLAIVDLEGRQISGPRKMTSEVKLHLHVYRNRPDVRAAVHVHPPHATAFCVARRQLPKCVLPEVEVFLGQIPMAPYATPGSAEFARSIDPFLKDHWVFLLTNHGALTLGGDPFDAYYKMETLENYCLILLLARQLGDWNTLDYQSMNELLAIKERLGIPDPRVPESLAALCTPGVPTEPSPAPGVAGDQPLSSPWQPGSAKQPRPTVSSRAVEEVVRQVLKEKGIL